MKTQKDINSYSYTPRYLTHRREGNYPANYGTYQQGGAEERRLLIRSTGKWKPGDGRKPEQPYTNSHAISNPLMGSVVAYQRNTGYGEFRHVFNGSLHNKGFWEGFSGDMNPAAHGGSVASFPVYNATGLNPDLLSQAEVKAYGKLDAFSPEKGDASVDVATAFGERRETGQLLMGAATGVLNVARVISGFDRHGWEFGLANALKSSFGVDVHPAELRRRYRRRAKRLSERSLKNEVTRGVAVATLMADVWLTYRLGVTPLMSELDGAYQALQDTRITPDQFMFRVSARHYRERGGLQKRPIDYKSSGIQEFYCFELHGYTVTFVACPHKGEIDKLARLGLDNLASTVWNLTTLTFVLDYLVSIGDWLEALNTPKRYVFQDGSWTQRIVRQYSTVLIGPEAKGRGHCTLDHTKRHVYTSFPVPIPPLSLNGEDLSLKRLLTMAALAVVKVRKLLT